MLLVFLGDQWSQSGRKVSITSWRGGWDGIGLGYFLAEAGIIRVYTGMKRRAEDSTGKNVEEDEEPRRWRQEEKQSGRQDDAAQGTVGLWPEAAVLDVLSQWV